MYEFIEVIKMNEIDASEIKIEETIHGYKVSLPVYGFLIRYSANNFDYNSDGQMTLISTVKGARSVNKAEYIKEGDSWVTEESGTGFLPKYESDSPEYEAFEALLKASG